MEFSGCEKETTIPLGTENQSGSTMPQLMLQGFPDGAIRIGPVVSVLSKDERVTYFVGPDNYFSHAAGDAAGQRMAIATLIANRHVRVCEVETSPLGIARRNLMRWTRQLAHSSWPVRSVTTKRGFSFSPRISALPITRRPQLQQSLV